MVSIIHAIPNLHTPLLHLLHQLEGDLVSQHTKIDDWFSEEWRKTPPPIYGSIDLRNAGFKLAPIDMNLFPAGFNNLNPNFLPIAVEAAKKSVSRFKADAKKILLIPESHSRNLFYWENVKTLIDILEAAGFEVRLGLLDTVAFSQIDLPSGKIHALSKVNRVHEQLVVDDFVADFILLNNDLSAGIPAELQGLTQPLVPPAELGWSQRLKSMHFQYYSAVAQEFSALIGIDSWLIDPLFRHCGKINFLQQSGLECLIHHAETLFEAIQKKYDAYQIEQQPFLIVKADAGTYGMAVMTVRNVDEIKTLNRKQRTRMSASKGGQTVDRVIIQEGVYTFETVNGAVAEPVVYLWGEEVVGGFYRVHEMRGVDESLNSPGMQFQSMAFPSTCNHPCRDKIPEEAKNRLYAYGLIAKLSMLAAAREMKEAR